jgi:hypothetical protein
MLLIFWLSLISNLSVTLGHMPPNSGGRRPSSPCDYRIQGPQRGSSARTRHRRSIGEGEDQRPSPIEAARYCSRGPDAPLGGRR